MMDFYRTGGGRRFIDFTVPELVVQLQRIANSLDRLLDLVDVPKAGTAAASPKKEGS